MTDQDTCTRWLNRIGAMTLLCIAVFLAFPTLDLRISGLFGSQTSGFPVRDLAGWNIIRAIMIVLTDGIITTAILALVLNLAIPAGKILRTRVLAFCITAYAIGPGLIVNGVLKTYSERARPWNIAEFGGSAHYSRPFELAGQCASHCSFVSGEASALTTVASLFLLVIIPGLPDRWRRPARVATVTIAVSGSLLRVGFGAHYLSDVVFAALLMGLTVPVLYLAFGLHRLPGPLADRFAEPIVDADATELFQPARTRRNTRHESLWLGTEWVGSARTRRSSMN